MRRVREEEELDEQRRARLEYSKHMRSICTHEEEYQAEECEEVDAMAGIEEEEPAAKRVRTFEHQTDENWFVEASPDATKTPAVPVMYTWAKDFELLKELGDSDDPKLCFGCRYHAISAHASIYAEDWQALVDFFRATMLMCPNATQLGVELYEFFDKTVGESLRKRNPSYAEVRWWSPYGIANHFLNHNRDPTVQCMRDYMAYNEIHSVIINNQMFEMCPETGRRTVNGDALKMLKTVFDMREKVLRMNPSQLPYAPSESSPTPKFMHPHSQLKQRPSLASVQSRWDS